MLKNCYFQIDSKQFSCKIDSTLIPVSAEGYSSLPSSYMYYTEKNINVHILFGVWLGFSSVLFGSYQTFVFLCSSNFLKHIS